MRNHKESLGIMRFQGFFLFKSPLGSRRIWSELFGLGPLFWGGKSGGKTKIALKSRRQQVGRTTAWRRRSKKMGIPIAVPLGVGKAMGIFAASRAKTRKLKTDDTEPNSRGF